MYINSLVKKGTFPTIDNLRKALEQADISNRGQADSRPLYSILMKLRNAPRVSGIMTTRKTAVTSFDWTVNAMEDSQKERALLKQVEHKKIINQLISWHTDFNVFGQFLAKIEYLPNDINPIKLHKYELTDFQKIDSKSFYLYDNETNTKTKIELADGQTEYLYMTDDNIEFGGDFASISAHTIYLNDILKEWNAIVSRVKGIAIGTIDAEAMNKDLSVLGLNYDQVAKDLGEALNSIGTVKALQTLKSVEIKLSSLVDSNAVASLVPYKDSLVSDIAVALLGQANTTELPTSGGSRSAIQILNLIRKDIVFSDINNVKMLINDFLDIEYRLTQDSNGILPYEFDFIYDDAIDVEASARKMQYLTGLNVLSKEVYQQTGFTMPEGTADTMIINMNNQPIL